MPTTWFTSDLHLGHPFVAELRGFDDVEEHDRVILNNLRDSVRPGDTLWVLGDISSGWRPQEERALELLDDLLTPLRQASEPLHVHLISGNHDSCHSLHEKAYERQARFLEVFDSVQDQHRVETQQLGHQHGAERHDHELGDDTHQDGEWTADHQREVWEGQREAHAQHDDGDHHGDVFRQGEEGARHE